MRTKTAGLLLVAVILSASITAAVVSSTQPSTTILKTQTISTPTTLTEFLTKTQTESLTETPTTVVIQPGTTTTETWTITLPSSFIAEVFFSPNGGCEAQVIHWINAANQSIHVLIYSFTLDDVGAALISATERGIDVKVVFEKSQISQYSEYQALKAAGLPVKNDTNSELMHHKVAIIDGYIILDGSFNWSGNAEERNNENLLVIRDPPLAQLFEAEFQKIWSQSVGPETTTTVTPTQTTTTTATTEQEFKYCGSINSDVYHYPWCSNAKKIKPENLVWFTDEYDAKSKGYRPCKVCNPPG